MSERLRILLVEDNPGDADLILELLPDAGRVVFETECVSRLSAALARVRADRFDLVLLDLGLPDSAGLETVRTLRAQSAHVPIVVLTGNDDEQVGLAAIQAGAQDYLIKGQVGASLLMRAMRYAIERRQAEAQRQGFYEMLNASLNELYSFNAETLHFEFVSAGALRNLGYTLEAMRGMTPLDLKPEFTPAAFEERLAPLRRHETPVVNFGTFHRRADGSTYPVEVHIQLFDEIESPVFLAVVLDVTERQQTEEALRASEERWQTLVRATPDFIALHDLEGRFLFLNRYAEGFTEKEVIGSSLFQYLAPDSVEIFRKHMEAAVVTGTPQRFEHTAQGDLAGLRTYEDYLVPIVSRKKETSILVVSRDITEHKQAEQALQGYSARLEAEVAQRTRELRDAQELLIRQEKLAVMGQLASSVAHELRNPLGVISNAVYFLEAVQANADAAVLDYLKMIAAEVNNADKIVTDLLDFARLKGVARETVDLNTLVELVLQKYPPAANVTVATEGLDALPPLFVDPRQIEQVLTNLVVNACQAMPEGGTLTLRAELTSPPLPAGPDPEPPWVRVQVADTGTGISSENMAKLFEPLFTTKAKGIGLGLAVSKKLTEANGGKIEVQSAPGRGTTFSVSLPAADRTKE